MKQSLQLRIGQSLTMTPQLQQAIRLLQLSNIELNAFVDAELERNPLLERDEDGDIGPRSQANGDAPESTASEEPRTSGETADLDFNETAVDYIIAGEGELIAEVFGGASMWARAEGALAVGERNVELAFRLLEEEKIKVVSQDVWGEMGRKVIFDTRTGSVLLRRNPNVAMRAKMKEETGE